LTSNIESDQSLVGAGIIAAVVVVLLLGLIYFRNWDEIDRKQLLYSPSQYATKNKVAKDMNELTQLRRSIDAAFIMGNMDTVYDKVINIIYN
jgi:hypothetical protein